MPSVHDILSTKGAAVHSIHTEIEGGRAFHELFRRQVAAWKDAGAGFVTIGEVASAAGTIPTRTLTFTTLPGRSTPVATGS